MSELENVTLFCIDDIDPLRALRLMAVLTKEGSGLGSMFPNSKGKKPFIKLFCSKSGWERSGAGDEEIAAARDGSTCLIELIDIPEINSLHDYSDFIIHEAHKYIDTDFAMCMQRDGYPLGPHAWDQQFLKYDYIGAPWTWAAPVAPGDCPQGRCVGNGGFSIRSKKLMEAVSKLGYNPKVDPVEDAYICREKGQELQDMGFNFAPIEVASRFSVENQCWGGQFGFHGKLTVELSEDLLRDQIFQGQTGGNLREFESVRSGNWARSTFIWSKEDEYSGPLS